jgi:hypothetical protein
MAMVAEPPKGYLFVFKNEAEEITMNIRTKIAITTAASIVSMISVAGAAFADDNGGNQGNYGYGFGYGSGQQQGYGTGGQTLAPPQIPGSQTTQTTVTLSSGWNLVDSAVNTALVQNGAQHYSDYWDGQKYSPNATGAVNGIWIYSPNGGTVTIASPNQSLLSMSIRPNSWGMIGNPYSTSQTITLQAGDFAYTYDPTSNQYSAAISGTLTLQAGQGAWLYSAAGGTYTVGFQPPAPPSTVTGTVYGSTGSTS